MKEHRPLIVIGIPGDKRTGGIQQARSRLGLQPAILLPYTALLAGRPLAELLEAEGFPQRTAASVAGPSAPLLRLDSPGGSFEVERALIALGAPDAGDYSDALHPFAHKPDPFPLSYITAGKLREMPGVLHHPSQWFRGYCRLLARLREEAALVLPDSRWLNDPQDIADMTDKRRTQQLLASAGVRVPRPLGGEETLADYASLRERMLRQRMHRIFIKLACGSAASGVIAYQMNPSTGAEIAVTTVGVENYITRPPIYYNSGKLRRYTDSRTIAGLINWVCRHGAYAEQWIPKSGAGGTSLDIRQLVVLGEACHSIARVSTTPITNLHLRSRRMSPAEAGLSGATLEQVRSTAVQALAAFPGSSVAGIDVLVSAGSNLTYAADVNPFGDLLYEVEYEGYGTYEWELKQLIKEGHL
ncbi:hypothetical protein D3C76_167650 [compost metagenome]